MQLNPYLLYRHGIQNPKSRFWVILLTLLYIILPLDLIPELIIPFVGLLDDGILLSILVTELTRLYLGSRQNPTKATDPNTGNFNDDAIPVNAKTK